MDMMQATATGPQTAPTAKTASADSGVIGSDFETFLVMLTAQIQNQDPLNPMESSDFAVQLATFAGVEQQVLTNQLLRSDRAGGAGQLTEFADWVGMDVRHQGPVLFQGEPVALVLPETEAATARELVVKSEAGEVLHRLEVAGGGTDYLWTGQTEGGATLLEGKYQLEVQTRAADGTSETQPVASYARVAEVRSSPDGVEIVLDGAQVLSADEILALRDPVQG